MKSANEIFRKLKEAKFRRWVSFYKFFSKKAPDNCKYNYPYNFIDNAGKTYILKLCLLHQDVLKHNLLDTCQTDADCKECNGFIQKWTREELKKVFLDELNTKNIKEKKYPEICALEWVLEKYNEDYPPISWIRALYFKIKKLLLRTKI